MGPEPQVRKRECQKSGLAGAVRAAHLDRVFHNVRGMFGMIRHCVAALGLLCISVGVAHADGIVLNRLPAASPTAEVKSLSFNGDGSQIIGNLTDGSIYAWPLDGTEPQLIAQTEQAFAYCHAGERMVISAGKAAVLLSLRDGGYSALSDGIYDHADFSADCNTMILAEADASAVELWRISEEPVLRNTATLAPVQNGVKLSSDGRMFAAATAPDLEDPTFDTAIEFFALAEDGTLRRAGLLQSPGAVLGLDGFELTKGGLVISASRNDGTSGLLAADARTGVVAWSWAGFLAERVPAVAMSADDVTVLSADSDGKVVLWSAAVGQDMARIRVGQPAIAAALSSDVSKAAIALADGRIVVLNLAAMLDGD